jgi:Txe/YoeB family toxin of Txe-Axe toxin-antitoxin module
LILYLRKRNLIRKFKKQIKTFSQNPSYPSLKTEILEPKSLKIYSFRIDKKYRAIFVIVKANEIEIVDINDHYK